MSKKKLEIEQVTNKPLGNIMSGRYIVPNSFNEYDGHLHQTDKIYYVVCAPCPWINQYVAPVECETCQFGKAGSYSEGWVKCSYEYEKKLLDPKPLCSPNPSCEKCSDINTIDCGGFDYLQKKYRLK